MSKPYKRRQPKVMTDRDGRAWERVEEAEAVLDTVIAAGELPSAPPSVPRRSPEGIMWRCAAQRKARDILGREAIFGDVEVVMVEGSSQAVIRYFVLRPVAAEGGQ